MSIGRKIVRFLIWMGIVIFQLIATQLVTFAASLLFPGMGMDFPQTRPGLFVFILGITFTIGVFLVGWLALKLHWLTTQPKYLIRLITTLIFAYFPLILALIVYHTLEPGNPFFFISMLTAVLGFHLPGWFK
jgi:hypothetical protein